MELSNDELETFITTFKSYMERASVSELNYLRRETNRKYREMYYTNQAKKHNVSLDYLHIGIYLGNKNEQKVQGGAILYYRMEYC